MRMFKVQDSLEELKMNVQLWVSDENVNKKSGDLLIALDDFEEQFLKLMDEHKTSTANYTENLIRESNKKLQYV